ncbi:MAG: hypothetical protein IIB22_04680 [Chloroflexi bacterium]|nr:hypothetical protein [Chloroflexota bacterium]
MRRHILALLVALAAAAFLILPSPRPAFADGMVAIATGHSHSCAVTAAGGVKCWGGNTFAALGDGTNEGRTTPVDVCQEYDDVAQQCTQPLSDIADVTAGVGHTCALTNAGGVKCWGLSAEGQLGAVDAEFCNVPGGSPFLCSTTPQEVVGLQSGVAAISAGSRHTCAALLDGGVQCWGWNAVGQLGDGSTTSRRTPVDVIGLASGVATVGLGHNFSCAVTTDGGVKCWGSNVSGILGARTDETCVSPFIGDDNSCSKRPLDVCQTFDPAEETCSEPLSGIATVAPSIAHTCALTTSGGVTCWGVNDGRGFLGDGERCGTLCGPVAVCEDSTCAAPLSNIAAVTAGSFSLHTCAVTRAGGVRCWGTGFHGALGDGSLSKVHSSPVGVCQVYDDVAEECMESLSGVISVDTGLSSTCALTEAGTVKCWGSNCGPPSLYELRQCRIPEDVLGLEAKDAAATGDVNCDGAVDATDAASLLQFHASLLSALPCLERADVNEDGVINALDALLILQHSAGLLASA